MKLNSRELGTVLAALRLWQIHTSDGEDDDGARCPEAYEWAKLDDIATYAGEPLSHNEIDELCERINVPVEAPVTMNLAPFTFIMPPDSLAAFRAALASRPLTADDIMIVDEVGPPVQLGLDLDTDPPDTEE